MQTVGLTWQHAGETAVVLAAAGAALSRAKRPALRSVGALFRETAVIGLLYGLWQLAGQISVSDDGEAFRRAHRIVEFEQYVSLPSEQSVQHLILGHPLLVQLTNLYYAAMHLTVMLGFLLWLFLRHRDRYRPVRQVMAWTTLGCLLLELIPVAPPRLLAGFVDTGLAYNQSVYDNALPIDQLSAMPSMHVAWAALVGYYVWRISPSRWRWIGPVHTVLVCFAVVATANHWWLDGVAAAAVLVVVAWGVYGVRRLALAVTVRRISGETADQSERSEPPSIGIAQPVR